MLKWLMQADLAIKTGTILLSDGCVWPWGWVIKVHFPHVSSPVASLGLSLIHGSHVFTLNHPAPASLPVKPQAACGYRGNSSRTRPPGCLLARLLPAGL